MQPVGLMRRIMQESTYGLFSPGAFSHSFHYFYTIICYCLIIKLLCVICCQYVIVMISFILGYSRSDRLIRVGSFLIISFYLASSYVKERVWNHENKRFWHMFFIPFHTFSFAGHINSDSASVCVLLCLLFVCLSVCLAYLTR